MAAVLIIVLAGLWAIQIFPQADIVFTPLNILTAQASAAFLAAIGLPVTQELTRLTHSSGFSCEIDASCTALVPALLLAAAIWGWRASWRARLIGVVVGVGALLIINQLRLVSLVWLGVQAPAWFEVTHVWLWPATLLFVTAGYWYVWTRVSA